jgi:hypothetical protein
VTRRLFALDPYPNRLAASNFSAIPVAADERGYQDRRAHRDQVPTRWRADGSSPAPTDARPCTCASAILDENAPSRACARHESARVRTCRPGQARYARRRWRPWTALRAPGGEPLPGGPRVPGDPVEVVPCVAGGDIADSSDISVDVLRHDKDRVNDYADVPIRERSELLGRFLNRPPLEIRDDVRVRVAPSDKGRCMPCLNFDMHDPITDSKSHV